VNKQGPIFDYKKEVLISKKSKKKKESPRRNIGIRMVKTTSNLLEEEEMHKRKIKEMSLEQNFGISFGSKTSLNPFLKNTRRQENQKIKEEINGLFDIENITMRTKFPKVNINNNNNKNDNFFLSENDNNSIRKILHEKKQTISLIKKAKRENKLMKVKNNQNTISKEINKKNELFISKIEKEAIDDSRYFQSRRFNVTIGNINININSDNEDNCKLKYRKYRYKYILLYFTLNLFYFILR
jgi:hypothetical protein